MQAMAEKFNWELRSEVPNADDQSIAQTYLELDLLRPAPAKITPTANRARQSACRRRCAHTRQPGADSLVVVRRAVYGPARLVADVRGHRTMRSISTTLDKHWWETSDLLYDTERHLYFRDVTYLHKTDERGNPIFWSRGNGWVMAGIARTLDDMPKDFRDRGRYETQLQRNGRGCRLRYRIRTMACGTRICSIPQDYPQPKSPAPHSLHLHWHGA